MTRSALINGSRLRKDAQYAAKILSNEEEVRKKSGIDDKIKELQQRVSSQTKKKNKIDSYNFAINNLL